MENGGKDAVTPRRSSRSRSAGGTSSGNEEQDTGSKSGTKSKATKKQQGEQSLSDAEEHRGKAAPKSVSFRNAEKEKTGGSDLVLQGGSETVNKNSESSMDGEMSHQREQASSRPIGGNIRGNAPLDLSWLMSPEGSKKQPSNEPAGSLKQLGSQAGGGVTTDPRLPGHEIKKTAVAGGGIGTHRAAFEKAKPVVGGGGLRQHSQDPQRTQDLRRVLLQHQDNFGPESLQAQMERQALHNKQQLQQILQSLPPSGFEQPGGTQDLDQRQPTPFTQAHEERTTHRQSFHTPRQDGPPLHGEHNGLSAPVEDDVSHPRDLQHPASETGEFTAAELEMVGNPVVQALLTKLAQQMKQSAEEAARQENQDRKQGQIPAKQDSHARTIGTHALRGRQAGNPEAKKKSHSVKIPPKEILSLLSKCPMCGKDNGRIPGDPLAHYLVCNKRKTHFTLTTVEDQALKVIAGLRRNIKKNESRHDRTSQLVKESRRQEREARRAGERNLNSTDSERSPSSEEGVQRDRDGYEVDSGSGSEDEDEEEDEEDEESGSEYEESSRSTSDSDSPAQRQSSKQRRSPPEHTKENLGDSESILALKRQITDQQHAQNDVTSLIHQLFHQVKELSQSVQRLSVPPASMTVTPSATRHENSRQRDNSRQSSESAQPHQERAAHHLHEQFVQQHQRTDLSFDYSPGQGQFMGRVDPGDQNFPEVPDDELSVAAAFEKHKKAYKGYLSKCSSNRRNAVSLAQTFQKWAEWIAVVFTEQEKQRAESQGSLNHLFFTKSSVLALNDEEFEARYLEMCGISMRDPSQVLDFLRAVEVDVSAGTVPKILAASESFRVKLRQIPSRALHATTAERVRNAFIESLFGEERGKRKRVDYDHLDSWEDVTKELTKNAARSTTGIAFEPFKPVTSSSKPTSSPSPSGPRNVDPHDPLMRGCDMRITSESKWFKRYIYFVNQNKMPIEQHGGSSSWKTRYIHVVDVADARSGRCTLCRSRGHVASACKDPLPDVLYPSSKPSRSHENTGKRSERNSEERQYRYRDDNGQKKSDQRNSQERYSGREAQRDRSPYRSEERNRQPHRGNSEGRDVSYRDDRQDSRGGGESRRNSEPRYRDYSREREGPRRDDSREREATPDRSRREPSADARTPLSPSSVRTAQLKPQNDGNRETSRERGDRSRRMTCYRCGNEGHMARECKATKDRDGRTLPDE